MKGIRWTDEQLASYKAALANFAAGKGSPKATPRPLIKAGRLDTPVPKASHLKYKNRPVGGYFSVKEARRAEALKLLRDGGEIFNLREQVVYLLIPKQEEERACKYVADFVYEDKAGREVVEDVKSPASRTPAYIIKRKLMLMVHRIKIVES